MIGGCAHCFQCTRLICPTNRIPNNNRYHNHCQAVADATAEIGLALMLAAARRVVAGNRRARARQFEGWWFGQTLSGKTLGVVGMGGIGLRLAQKSAAAFGMQVRT